ncbi:MAG: DUF1501 domain-containing protein, partial [Planctomycetia bacterium]|nr:DUF1501 domain-containing protein [Planctomycetia bacterium]
MPGSFHAARSVGGIHRRQALQLGGACLGLNLAGLWQAQLAAGTKKLIAPAASPIRSCILVFYYGGPSHIDTYDLKPQAPVDVRGEFQPIATSVPGQFVCEHLPHMSRLMHKVALVRSVHHQNRLHDSASTEALTGRQSPQGDREEFAPISQFYPCLGSMFSFLSRDRQIEIPHAALPFIFHNVVDVPCQGGGFLGSSWDPLQIAVDVEAKAYRAGALALPAGQTSAILSDRRHLLSALDTTLTGPATQPGRQWQAFYDRAFQLLGSESLRRALDLSQESPATRDRYG